MVRSIPPALAVLLSTLLLPVAASAQRPAAARHEARDARRDARDDRHDLQQIIAISRAWHAAVAAGNQVAEAQADARLNAWLARELREDRRELQENRRESNRSARERRRSRRRVRGAPSPTTRRNLRDDRRDARDDRRDQSQARQDYAQTRAIATRLQSLQRPFLDKNASAAQYTEKRRLLGELVALARRDIRQSEREVREDRRERRETRRQRR